MRYNRSLRKAELVEFAKTNNLSPAELALKFGYGISHTRRMLREAGIRVSPNRRSKTTQKSVERRSIIASAIENGWTLRELGESLGVSRERARQLIAMYKADNDRTNISRS